MTVGRSLLALLTVVNLCFPAAADGQTAEQIRTTTKSQEPLAGKFLGFVPAHLKVESHWRSPKVAVAVDDEVVLKTVQQANYVLPDEQPAVAIDVIEMRVEPENLQPFLGETTTVFPVGRLGSSRSDGIFLWGRADYLFWWTSGLNVPPLATTSPNGTLVGQAGVLGQTGTSILFGGEGLDDQSRSGGRFTLGTWLDPCHCRGLEFTYMMLGEDNQSFTASNNEFSILARPFNNVVADTEDARRIAFPGEVSGTLNIRSSTDLHAFETMYRVSVMATPCQRISYLVGYRFAELEDQIGIHESTLALSGALAGTTFDLRDEFNTKNKFHGGALGVVFECQSGGGWSWEAVAKVALGSTQSRVSVFGETITTNGAGSTTTQAGLLALPTNIGTFKDSYFSTVSEFGVTLRHDCQCGLSTTVGYTFLYWNDVARAGEQIDLGINTSQIPPGVLTGLVRPIVPFEKSAFWAQGIRCGVEYAY